MGTLKDHVDWLKLVYICVSYRLYLQDLLRTSRIDISTDDQLRCRDRVSKHYQNMPSCPLWCTVPELQDQIKKYRAMISELFSMTVV